MTVSGGKGTVSFDEETTKLYRVMSEEEYESVVSNGKFVPYERAMEEKWFATTQDDAIKWANIFYPDGKYKMLEVTIKIICLTCLYSNKFGIDKYGISSIWLLLQRRVHIDTASYGIISF